MQTNKLTHYVVKCKKLNHQQKKWVRSLVVTIILLTFALAKLQTN